MKRVALLIIMLVFLPAFSASAQPPPSQEMGGEVRTQEMQEKERALHKQIREKKKPAQIEEKLPGQPAPAVSSERALIKTIDVAGVTLIPEKNIREIVQPYENKELTLSDMQKIADLITELYRKKGYVTSRAYLPPQKLDSGALQIRVIEGKMGDLTVKDNYHYKTFLFKKKFSALKKNDPFNFKALAKIVRKINEQPDRTATAIMTPGKEPGETDVQLDVKDSLPVHAGLDFDNYASRYLFKNRYQVSAIDNNLLGFEDIFSFRYMLCEGDSYQSYGMTYLLPLTDTLKFGFYGSTAKLHLINNAKPFGIYGESNLMSFYLNQSIVDYDNANFSVDFGFDYKDVFNYQFDNETSRDRMRRAKTDFNLFVN